MATNPVTNNELELVLAELNDIFPVQLPKIATQKNIKEITSDFYKNVNEFKIKIEKIQTNLLTQMKKFYSKLGSLLKSKLRINVARISTPTVRHVQSRAPSSSKSNADPDSEPSHSIQSSTKYLHTLSKYLCITKPLSTFLSVVFNQQVPHAIANSTAHHSVDNHKEYIRCIDHEDRILRLPDVIKRTGLSRSSIYCKLDPNSPYYDPSFPKKINLSLRSIGFLESELTQWIESKHFSNWEK